MSREIGQLSVAEYNKQTFYPGLLSMHVMKYL